MRFPSHPTVLVVKCKLFWFICQVLFVFTKVEIHNRIQTFKVCFLKLHSCVVVVFLYNDNLSNLLKSSSEMIHHSQALDNNQMIHTGWSLSASGQCCRIIPIYVKSVKYVSSQGQSVDFSCLLDKRKDMFCVFDPWRNLPSSICISSRCRWGQHLLQKSPALWFQKNRVDSELYLWSKSKHGGPWVQTYEQQLVCLSVPSFCQIDSASDCRVTSISNCIGGRILSDSSSKKPYLLRGIIVSTICGGFPPPITSLC